LMTYFQELTTHATTYTEFDVVQKHTRCSGCGNYGIINAIKSAITLSWYQHDEVIFACDVWCNGNVSDKIDMFTIHGLHGRVTALAAGIHVANPAMPVICTAGDGSTLSEGINHLIHSVRNNYNVTFILHNNQNYGLTTGQASSTTPKGQKMKGTAWDTFATNLNPCALVLASGGTFVARGYSGDVAGLTSLIQSGMAHQGFSFIEVLQHCPTYNKATPLARYEKSLYDISERSDYIETDRLQAFALMQETTNVPTGILYKNPDSQDFYKQQVYRSAFQAPVEEVKRRDVRGLLERWVV
jgi:2-oxoglutarate/2-oxoacid ferredoxin oxidoreductase subunit beta